MHSAPAVSYPVGRSSFQGWLVGLLCLMGIISGLFWFYQSDPGGWRPWLFPLVMLCSCIVAVHAWSRSRQGRLRWDGQAWSWIQADRSVCGVLTVHLDLQFCLVVCLHLDGGTPIWLWPERSTEVAEWNALRQAVFGHAGSLGTGA